MALPFFIDRRETPASLRRKAEELLARSDASPVIGKGQNLTGENRLNRAGPEGDFRQFRDYRPEDRPKDIDWKRSARSDATLVREREKKQQLILDLYIQNYPGMHFHSAKLPTKYETAGVIGIAFALWADRNHNPVYFRGERVSKDDLPSVILGQKSPPTAKWKKNAITVLIGDYTDPINDLEKVFSGIPSQQIVLLQILDPAELELPWHGRHIFNDGNVKSIINDADAIRRDYQSAFQAHIEALRAYCKQRGWHYGLIRSDSDAASPFSAALAFLGETR